MVEISAGVWLSRLITYRATGYSIYYPDTDKADNIDNIDNNEALKFD